MIEDSRRVLPAEGRSGGSEVKAKVVASQHLSILLTCFVQLQPRPCRYVPVGGGEVAYYSCDRPAVRPRPSGRSLRIINPFYTHAKRSNLTTM